MKDFFTSFQKRLDSLFKPLSSRLPHISDKAYHRLAILMVLGVTAAYTILMLNWYWQFQYFFVDNVYFHSALWKLANFQEPVVWHPFLRTINIFGDHFHPTILLVAGLMRIFPWNEVVFIIMALSFGLSGYLAFLIGFKILKSRPLTFIMVLAYFLYIAAQNAMIYGFHEINLMPLFFMMTMYSLLSKKWAWYWVSLALLLLTKETIAPIGIGIGLFCLLGLRRHRRIGVATILVSLTWFVIATRLIIPHFSNEIFLYNSANFSGTKMPASVTELYERVTQPQEKIETFTVSMLSFGLLPLLNIATLPLVLQDFALRYIFSIPGNVQYTLSYHYGIALTAILFFSSVWSLKVMQDRFKARWLMYLLAAFTLVMTAYYQRLYHIKAPLLLVINPDFYRSTPRNQFLWDFISHVPPEGRIMTMNHLGVPFSRQGVVPFAHNPDELIDYDPDYVVYDLREGQNPNNFNPYPEAYVQQMVQDLQDSGAYEVYYQSGDQFILKKSGGPWLYKSYVEAEVP